MNSEAETLFHAVVDLSPADREKEFTKRKPSAEVRAEVEAMLRFDEGGDHTLTACIGASAESTVAAVPPLIEGARCGQYQLIRILGRGGMGSVFLAQRADGEVDQLVAIKLLNYGVDDPAFRERFLRERQILATLNHPGIARLLDAGHTDGGQPYLVMEYVDGAHIDNYATMLDLDAKLRLFLEVCEAVSYAHRNLVVHRDLKPSNILVDREGRPKLLDFGIAKIVDPAQPGAPERTIAGSQALTPQYASPEQVRGETITTATDVYSLGLVLYRLLTGRYAYEFPAYTPAAIDHTVCEVQPDPPRISGDLDNILLMALRKEPARRYHSVEQFAEDIGRTMLDRPVLARPDTVRYRAGKFLRRHRIGVAAAVVALAALLGEAGIAVYEGHMAQRRFQEVRKLAHTFVFDLHDQIAKLEGSTQARETMVRTGLEYLDSLARNAGADLDLQREIAAAYMKIGDAEGYPTKPNLGRIADAVASYRKAGDIYRRLAGKSSVYMPDLAEYYLSFAGLLRFNDQPQAKQMSEAALQTFDRARARQRFDEPLELRNAYAWCVVGDIDEDMGSYRESLTEFSRCSDMASAQMQRRRTGASISVVAQAAERVATASQELGMLEAARQALDEDESLLDELLAAEPRNPNYRRRKAIFYQFRSMLYFDDSNPHLGDPARSLESARRYLAAAEEMVRNDPDNAAAKFSRAVAMYRVSIPLREFDPEAAVRMARESVRSFEELMAAGKPSLLMVSTRASALRRLADALLKAGRPAEAKPWAEAALDAHRSLAVSTAADSDVHANLVQTLILVSRTSEASRDFGRAERLLREALDVARPIAKRGAISNAIPLAGAEQALGEFYSRRGRDAETRQCYQRLADLWRNFPGSNVYVDRQRAAVARRLESLTELRTPRG